MPCLVSCLFSLSLLFALYDIASEQLILWNIFSTPCHGMYTQQHTRQNAVHGWELGGMEDERDLKMRCDVILKFSFTTSAAWRRDGGGFGTTRLVWSINHPPTGFLGKKGRMCFDVSWLPFSGCKFIYILRWARTQILNAFLPKTCSTYSQGGLLWFMWGLEVSQTTHTTTQIQEKRKRFSNWKISCIKFSTCRRDFFNFFLLSSVYYTAADPSESLKLENSIGKLLPALTWERRAAKRKYVLKWRHE